MEKTPPSESVPPLFAGYVRWLLDRDPQFAKRLIDGWDYDTPQEATHALSGPGRHSPE